MLEKKSVMYINLYASNSSIPAIDTNGSHAGLITKFAWCHDSVEIDLTSIFLDVSFIFLFYGSLGYLLLRLFCKSYSKGKKNTQSFVQEIKASTSHHGPVVAYKQQLVLHTSPFERRSQHYSYKVIRVWYN